MKTIDVQDVLDHARFGAFQWKLLLWCALIIVFDGYDLVVYGVVLPALMKQWALTPLQAGALGSYALFGMMFGALIFGSLSDKWGRKPVIVLCVLLFSGFTVLNAFVRSPAEFGWCRFLAGLGIGGVMPNVVALMTEYAPRRMRSLLVATMFSGYSVGGMLAAGLGIVLLPKFGWSAVFLLGGIPLLLLPLILRSMPESLRFLLRRGQHEQARHILHGVAPELQLRDDDALQMPEPTPRSLPLVELFRGGRAMSTLLLWTTFFCCLLMVYALSSWLPKLMNSAGYGLGSSLSFLLVLNVGAIFGAIGGGWLGDRLQLRPVLIGFFVTAAVSIALLGFKSPLPVLYGLIAVAGATTIGTQILAYAFVAQFYPTDMRSTGIGWASGVGRSGAILGPMLGGALMSLEVSLPMNFLAFAIPGAVAGLAMALVGGGLRPASTAARLSSVRI